ncbi:MAG TPA: AzlC family ABC transporter permease [Mycobacteriales bacterium]|nr:AzlC family ABC transporter permease [Mycobacteriales bacterium]
MTAAPPERDWRDGLRDGMPFAGASALLSLSFGVVATDVGLPAVAAVVMSAVVFAGSAQFAVISVLAAGGGVGAATVAAALMNSRFVPMGFAVGPSLHGGRLRRTLEGQAVVDSSWAMAARGDGRFDRTYLFAHTGVQYVAWVAGTLVGAFVPVLDARALGLDAVFPAFFLVILGAELRQPGRWRVALAGAVLALLLVPVAPPGVPVLVASTAALVGLRTRA